MPTSESSPTTDGLIASDLGRRFGDRWVLRHVDVGIHPGEVVALVGPNGGGKTTLFRGLLGLIPPQEGAVDHATGRVGYVPQHEELDEVYPLTALEVVEFGALGRFNGLNRWWRKL